MGRKKKEKTEEVKNFPIATRMKQANPEFCEFCGVPEGCLHGPGCPNKETNGATEKQDPETAIKRLEEMEAVCKVAEINCYKYKKKAKEAKEVFELTVADLRKFAESISKPMPLFEEKQ